MLVAEEPEASPDPRSSLALVAAQGLFSMGLLILSTLQSKAPPSSHSLTLSLKLGMPPMYAIRAEFVRITAAAAILFAISCRV